MTAIGVSLLIHTPRCNPGVGTSCRVSKFGQNVSSLPWKSTRRTWRGTQITVRYNTCPFVNATERRNWKDAHWVWTLARYKECSLWCVAGEHDGHEHIYKHNLGITSTLYIRYALTVSTLNGKAPKCIKRAARARSSINTLIKNLYGQVQSRIRPNLRLKWK